MSDIHAMSGGRIMKIRMEKAEFRLNISLRWIWYHYYFMPCEYLYSVDIATIIFEKIPARLMLN